MIPVILCGGSGTRLWPLSRSHYPKQFLRLASEHTLLQETLLRLDGLEGVEAPIVVCNAEHRFIVAEQLREIGMDAGRIILEPFGRNTAPAVALAALYAGSSDETLLVLPADHVIPGGSAFCEAVDRARRAVEAGGLVTFGVVPSGPETGYGYIRRGEAVNDEVFKVASFVEKPDRSTAENYLDSGDYFWNSGMFVFRGSDYLAEMERRSPEMLACCRSAVGSAAPSEDFLRLDEESFAACPADSIDYAVMEKTDRAVVVPLAAGWNDIGSWAALWDVSEKDATGNTLQGDVVLHDSKGSHLHAESRLVAGIGLEDLVVVETADAVMVAPKDRVQDVKLLVESLKQADRPECADHRMVYRPWGSYDSIDAGDRHQAKRLVVKPGAKLSLQMHHHRAEHWVVVRGTAQVTRGDEVFLLSENESTYIPIGTRHSLENPGNIPLEVIEVQSGSYLGEDDIVRFDDMYGRAGE